MDADLVSRWRTRRPPFNGVTLVMPWPGVKLTDLRATVRTLLKHLKAGEHDDLETLEDWHEHDGYVKAADRSGWSELDRALQSNESFLALWPGDTFVRRGFAPRDRAWYLRISFDDDDELDNAGRPTRGTIDLTGSVTLTANVAQDVPGLERHSAAEFFDKRYAG